MPTRTISESPKRALAETKTLFKRLLVPLDGSAMAEQALPFARTLARVLAADLILVRAASPRLLGADQVEAQIKAGAEAEAYFERLGQAFQTDYAVEYSLPFGEPASEIANVARVREADLIVMTTHGRSGLSRAMRGSVADALIRKSDVPLLLIRAGLPIHRWEQGLRRMLVPLDGSELAESILLRMTMLARVARARLTLFQVIGPPMPEVQPLEIAQLSEDDSLLADQVRGHLNERASWARERGAEADVEVAFGWPAQRIAEAASSRHDLVAMATHARAGIDRLIAGSVADEVLRKASVPLLLFRR